MGLKGKLTTSVEVKCGGHLKNTLILIIESVKAGSVVSWSYNEAGQKKFIKQVIEAIDLYKISICWKAIERDVL
ncbi:hypothetical protein H5410_021296 [Solanum commersonii]|uniref:Bet v I/Major latex protein domain-containing protein n=1 Tax=Solanum commersonii TaxID=4109 RepID=A0A9J5ZDK3_SOLCO|nr:hypothetical protein H5410_021296 [Solanum commersonii]